MKAAGYFLITLGFLEAALVSVIAPLEVSWGWYAAGLLVATLGVALVRFKSRLDTGSAETIHTNMQDLEASLESILASLKTLRAELNASNPYEIHPKIDEVMPGPLNTFVNARKAIIHRYGLQHYAEVMSAFATGERYINRVWSASCDGYIDEVTLYLGKAEHQFAEALQLFRQAGSESPGPSA